MATPSGATDTASPSDATLTISGSVQSGSCGGVLFPPTVRCRTRWGHADRKDDREPDDVSGIAFVALIAIVPAGAGTGVDQDHAANPDRGSWRAWSGSLGQCAR